MVKKETMFIQKLYYIIIQAQLELVEEEIIELTELSYYVFVLMMKI